MRTALYDRHLALGAKMVTFSEWEMPLQYQGVLAEHQAVRQSVGLFDVSHMGRIQVRGEEAEPLLDFLSTNRLAGRPEGSATYTVWCTPEGGSVDDLLIYKLDSSHFFVVANAGNREKDLAHLRHWAAFGGWRVTIEERFEGAGILALQGPAASALLSSLMPEAAFLKPMHVLQLGGEERFVSTTGYTGAPGFELCGPSEWIVEWWERLLEQGASYGIQPVGLGARDTLRLEAGFALYGHELSETIAPNESVAAWAVKWNKSRFLGKEALERIERGGKKRFAYGIRLVDRGIARQGCPVSLEGVTIGEVTSGSFSPVLGESIALILSNCPLEPEDELEVSIRQARCRARLSRTPFIGKTP